MWERQRQRYAEVFGANAPADADERFAMRAWARSQRRYFFQGSLKADRRAALEAMGPGAASRVWRASLVP